MTIMKATTGNDGHDNGSDSDVDTDDDNGSDDDSNGDDETDNDDDDAYGGRDHGDGDDDELDDQDLLAPSMRTNCCHVAFVDNDEHDAKAGCKSDAGGCSFESAASCGSIVAIEEHRVVCLDRLSL